MQFRKEQPLPWGQSQILVVSCWADWMELEPCGRWELPLKKLSLHPAPWDWLAGSLWGIFFDCSLMWEGVAHCGEGHTQADGPGMYEKGSWGEHSDRKPGQWPSAMPFLSGFVLTAAPHLMVTNTNPDFPLLLPGSYWSTVPRMSPQCTESTSTPQMQSHGPNRARKSIRLGHEQNVGQGDRVFSWNWHKVNNQIFSSLRTSHSSLQHLQLRMVVTFVAHCSVPRGYKYHIVLTYVNFFIQQFKTLYYQATMED